MPSPSLIYCLRNVFRFRNTDAEQIIGIIGSAFSGDGYPDQRNFSLFNQRAYCLVFRGNERSDKYRLMVTNHFLNHINCLGNLSLGILFFYL